MAVPLLYTKRETVFKQRPNDSGTKETTFLLLEVNGKLQRAFLIP